MDRRGRWPGEALARHGRLDGPRDCLVASGKRPRPRTPALPGRGLRADNSDDALLLPPIAGTAPVMPTIGAFPGCRTLDHPSLISEQLLPLFLPVFTGRFALSIAPSGNYLVAARAAVPHTPLWW